MIKNIPENRKEHRYYLEFLDFSDDAENLSNVYTKNDTMRMLGRQPSKPFWFNPTVKEQIFDIAEALPGCFDLTAAYNLFMLGYVHGKKEEQKRQRAKRRKKQC